MNSLCRELCSSVVRQAEVQVRTNSHNPMRVDVTVTLLIVVLNVEEVSGLSKPLCLVEVSQIAPHVRIVHDTLLIALWSEVATVNSSSTHCDSP